MHITQYFHTLRHSLKLRPGFVIPTKSLREHSHSPNVLGMLSEPHRLPGITILSVEAAPSLPAFLFCVDEAAVMGLNFYN